MKRRLFYLVVISFFIGVSLFFWAVNNQTQILLQEIIVEKQQAALDYQQLVTDYQVLRKNYLQQKQGTSYQEVAPETVTSFLYFTQQMTLAEWQKRAWPFTKEEMFTEIRQKHMTDQLTVFPIIGNAFRLTNMEILNHKWLIALFISEAQNVHVVFEYGVDAQGQLSLAVLDYWRNEKINYDMLLLSDKQLLKLLSEAIIRAQALGEIELYSDTELISAKHKQASAQAALMTEERLLAWLSEVYTVEGAHALMALPAEEVYDIYVKANELLAAELIIQQKDHALYNVEFAEMTRQMELVFILDRGWRVNTLLYNPTKLK